MRHILISFLLCCGPLSPALTVARDKPACPKTDLGFDAGKVPPPDPKKEKPVARVLDQYIYPDQPPLKSPVSDKDKMFALQCYILGPLLDRFKQHEKIEPTRDELAQLEALLKKANSETAGVTHLFFYRMLTGKHDAGQHRTDAIVLWKIERALYQRYGGVVGLSKFRGPMPIDAYREFLEDAERTGAVEIYDLKLRAALFEQLQQKPRFVVPPEEVDFETPWWVQPSDGTSK